MKYASRIHPRLYRIWTDMRRRCEQPHRPDFKWYGARGIVVCAEWKQVGVFINWACAAGYADGLTLDRIDVNGDYAPANCRWTTIQQQERNRRNNHRIEHNGETKCLSEWAEKAGISQEAMRGRLVLRGWSMERALCTPIQ